MVWEEYSNRQRGIEQKEQKLRKIRTYLALSPHSTPPSVYYCNSARFHYTLRHRCIIQRAPRSLLLLLLQLPSRALLATNVITTNVIIITVIIIATTGVSTTTGAIIINATTIITPITVRLSVPRQTHTPCPWRVIMGR